MRRVLLKLSGEALGGEAGAGVDPKVVAAYCDEIIAGVRAGLQIAVVLGGGNLFRGAALAKAGMDRVAGDRMGMLATVMNGLALADFLRQFGIQNTLFSSIALAGVVNGYNRDEALDALAGGSVVILVGGTGNPYFTTDTAACLRGIELQVDSVLKGTNVDGIYDDDPRKNPNAKKFSEITYDEVLNRKLGVMDLTAITLCSENAMPLVVFRASQQGALVSLANGEVVGTRVTAS